MLVRVVWLSLVTTALGCGSKGYDEKTCAQYKDLFLKTCTETCEKKVDHDICAPKCAAALPKDRDYAAKCVAAAPSK
jgi:hypothetical protein